MSDDGSQVSNTTAGFTHRGNRTLLHVANLSKSGQNYDEVRAMLEEIVADIDPKCLSFLQSGGLNLGTYVSEVLGASLLAVGDFTPNYAAFTGIGGTDVPPGTAAIVVNNGGAFFSSSQSADQGKITGGTAKAQAFILLHELGHALGAADFRPDLNNDDATASNDKLIEKNCSKTLKEF